jgi:formylmethanofuran dehydrogenase subunit E-like metal-binding protein
MFFYEIHEGDEDLGGAVLLAHEQRFEPLEFFALVKKARTLLVDSFEEASLSEAIANELARTAEFIHVTDDLLVASVNVDVTEQGTFLVSEEAGERSVFLSSDDDIEN